MGDGLAGKDAATSEDLNGMHIVVEGLTVYFHVLFSFLFYNSKDSLVGDNVEDKAHLKDESQRSNTVCKEDCKESRDAKTKVTGEERHFMCSQPFTVDYFHHTLSTAPLEECFLSFHNANPKTTPETKRS
ncbi:hypothetical protein ACRRTK_004200 [Alexandromys fortis]